MVKSSLKIKKNILPEVETMSNHEERFDSLARVYGKTGLTKLTKARIIIVGIGGVGSWVAEALARTAVGHLHLIDGDDISRSNINRQSHALESSLAKTKVAVMQQRILDINPDCHCKITHAYLGEGNLQQLIPTNTAQRQGEKIDCVIDATDKIIQKSMLIAHCKRNKITIITTGGAGGLLDPSKVEVKDLSRTWNDPLAASVRLHLRQNYNFARNLKRSFGVPCVYSTEQPRYPTRSGRVTYKKPGVSGLSLDCSSAYGSAVNVTASFGFCAAAKAVERIIAC